MNDGNILNARFIQVNQLPQIDSHLTARLYVDNATDESSLVRNNQDNDLNNNNLTHINSITLNKQAGNENEVITKAYVDHFHNDNERTRRDLGIEFYNESGDLVKNNQDNDLNDIKLTDIYSTSVNRNPTPDNELSAKKYIDDELDKNTILRFKKTPEKYLKVSVGNDTYNITKYNEIQLTDTAIIKTGNSGGYLLSSWRIFCNDINNGKTTIFLRATKTSSPTSESGATSLLPIGNSFMYLETSGRNHDNNIFVSFERIDVIQITNITFYYIRFSKLTNDSIKSMGRFKNSVVIRRYYKVYSIYYT